MLIKKSKALPYNTLLKLFSGEEVIAKVIAEDNNYITIEKPLQMIMGQQGPQFAPFMMLADQDKEVNIFQSAIVAQTEPNSKLEEQYESITSSIALPKRPSIITN